MLSVEAMRRLEQDDRSVEQRDRAVQWVKNYRQLPAQELWPRYFARVARTLARQLRQQLPIMLPPG